MCTHGMLIQCCAWLRLFRRCALSKIQCCAWLRLFRRCALSKNFVCELTWKLGVRLLPQCVLYAGKYYFQSDEDLFRHLPFHRHTVMTVKTWQTLTFSHLHIMLHKGFWIIESLEQDLAGSHCNLKHGKKMIFLCGWKKNNSDTNVCWAQNAENVPTNTCNEY
jgi:hypothetical protein